MGEGRRFTKTNPTPFRLKAFCSLAVPERVWDSNVGLAQPHIRTNAAVLIDKYYARGFWGAAPPLEAASAPSDAPA
jgi:hypothetical protein